MLEAASESDSWTYRLDPRLKIIMAVLYSVMMAVFYRFEAVLTGLFLSVFIAAASGLSFREILKRLIPVNIFMIFLWVFLPFTYAGTPMVQIWKLTLTHEGVRYAALITVKSNALMLMLVILTLSTPVFTLGNALHQLRLPQKLVYLLFFTYRYIHVIRQEYIRLLNAMKIRGFAPKTDWHTYKSYAYMVGMLLVKSAERAKSVHNAMRCRGFTGNFYCLNEYRIRRSDMASAALMAGILLLMGVIEWTTIIA